MTDDVYGMAFRYFLMKGLEYKDRGLMVRDMKLWERGLGYRWAS
jgi:hypothetical protein